MGLLDARTRILDVVLTETGRYDLSKNQLNFSYFAFSDDGIDYSGSIDYVNTPNQHIVPLRVQSTFTGTTSTGAATITPVMSVSPLPGSSMIAVIGLQGASRQVNSITQTGATWVKLTSSSDNSNGTHCELWWANNLQSSAGSSSLVTTNSIGQTVVNIAEYKGVVSVDKSASHVVGATHATGSTGITLTTIEPYELWIGGMATLLGATQSVLTPSDGVKVAFTGASNMYAGMFEKYTSSKTPAEFIISFSPDGTVIGCISTFKISTSASLKENLDDFVHTNTFAFEPIRKEDKILNNYLFTMPLQSEVVTQFSPSTTGSFVLNRKYDIETLESVVNGAAEIEKLIAQGDVLDYVIIVEDAPITESGRGANHVIQQFQDQSSAALVADTGIIGLLKAKGIV